MSFNEEEDVFDEKLWEVIKIVLKKRPGATIKTINNIISMSAQGKLYTRKEIERCISLAIDNGFIIATENGKILESGKIEEDNKKETIEQFQHAEEEIKENFKKQEEAKTEKKAGGFLSSRKGDSGWDR